MLSIDGDVSVEESHHATWEHGWMDGCMAAHVHIMAFFFFSSYLHWSRPRTRLPRRIRRHSSFQTDKLLVVAGIIITSFCRYHLPGRSSIEAYTHEGEACVASLLQTNLFYSFISRLISFLPLKCLHISQDKTWITSGRRRSTIETRKFQMAPLFSRTTTTMTSPRRAVGLITDIEISEARNEREIFSLFF